MTPESFVLDLDAVSIHRGDETVLNNLTWRMLPGENWAVLGANGSGKSSFAAALTGEAASSGEIRYGFDDGMRDPCERIASVSFRLHREFVAQSDSYYQSRWYLGDEDHTLTAGKVLRAAAGRSKDAAARLAHVVKLMDIRRVLKRQTLHLSTGEMRRVLIARALLLKPALLILDEPFIGLDVAGRTGLMRSLAAIMRAGQPILFLTARPNDAEMPQGLTHALYLRDGALLGTARLSSARAKKLQRATFAKAPRVTPPLTAVKQPRRNPDAAPVIALTDINLSMGGVSILKHVNWSVRPGERWSVSGPNGAGKTTMLSLLNGDHPQAFAQDVRLFGRTRGDFTLFELKALIGWASPDIALHYGNQTSALEFVCTGFFETLGLYQGCSRRQQQIARKWIAYFGLTPAADRPFRVLSDAQQRLALLARALVKPRRLVVLDEPCQGLDPASQELVLRAIDTFCRQAQTALVIVTHYASELPSCITHRLALEAGRVRRAGKI